MRKLKELLRLHFESRLSHRAIARSLNMSSSTIGEHLKRFQTAGLSWPLPEDLDDAALEGKLFPEVVLFRKVEALPDWRQAHQELKRKGVTLALLWEEYRVERPEGLGYSRFCELYGRFARTLRLSMRQVHKAGEKAFVDYAGQTMPVTDRETGEVRQAQIFLAVLGASNYTFAEASWTQALPDWIDSHSRAFEFFGGVTELTVPDNLRSGVSKAHRYDPEINPTYREWARHFGTAIMPARARKPKDKAKAEGGVLVAERWVLAALRNRTFFSLDELNAELRKLCKKLNERPFQKLPGSRYSEYLRLDRPALKPLPTTPFSFGEWSKQRVGPDYHIEAARHHYSVPSDLVGETVDIRVARRTVEIFHRGRRVASHRRSDEAGGKTTVREHMPIAHQRYLEWTPEKIEAWAEKAGYETYCFFQAILADRPHFRVGYRACQGVIRLEKTYPVDRIEAACRRANLLGITRVDSLASILANGLDRLPVSPPAETTAIEHENIRGANYYGSPEIWAVPRFCVS
jgi:transposase